MEGGWPSVWADEGALMNTPKPAEECQCTIQTELFNGGGDSVGMFCDTCHKFHGKVNTRPCDICSHHYIDNRGSGCGISNPPMAKDGQCEKYNHGMPHIDPHGNINFPVCQYVPSTPCPQCGHTKVDIEFADACGMQVECQRCHHMFYMQNPSIEKTCMTCANFSNGECIVGRLEEVKGYDCDYCGNWCTERIFYVNAYEVTRNYGGPEEGGWWYNLHVPIASVPVIASSRDDAKIKEKVKELEEFFKDRSYGNIYSMKGGQELNVYVEDKFAELEPKERPHYE